MSENDNTVNIESGKNRYHHGDLRAALIEEGLKLIDKGPADALSLREIARNAGVSATAVYRHFPDKAALLGALCLEGHARMAAAFRKAMAASTPGVEAFTAMGRAYVHFALAHPALFRMMMAQTGGPVMAPPPTSGAEGSDGMQILVNAIDGLFGSDTPPQVREARRLKAWSLVHGLAMLMLDGQVPAEPALIDAVVDVSML
ncbi:MAG: TetR/AcrR family transcriptional regulator [Hyphomonas sp.]|jgi:AcrR family transcriptional regulator|nr:TetR/AcrR family transcriptional regulator [Hyphomonas sp.]